MTAVSVHAAMVLNIAVYHFVSIDDPDGLAAQLQRRAEQAELRGTILVAEEGLNLFLAGEAQALRRFLHDLRDDARFMHVRVKESLSQAQPFARLKVKVKPQIIPFRRGGSSPLAARAPSVVPETLARWIAQGHDDAGRRLVLLDARNREEVAFGTFAGALTLPIDNFSDFPEALTPHREALRDAVVVSFCTGGIRCEKAALWLHNDGMDNVLQLDGGILGYFEHVGAAGYEGRCFVFDERVALDTNLNPLFDAITANPQDG